MVLELTPIIVIQIIAGFWQLSSWECQQVKENELKNQQKHLGISF